MNNEFGPGAIRISQKYVAHANQFLNLLVILRISLSRLVAVAVAVS